MKREGRKFSVNKRHNTAKNVTQVVPSVCTAFKVFVSCRILSAICSYISDCDETYNYWEPLHFIIYGHGLQTWEYNPNFALRSYTYVLLHGLLAWIYEKLYHPNPILIFYAVRCMLSFICALMECFMYKSICQEFGVHIGRLWLIFQLFNVGMFISSTALLPSSFAMYFVNAALAAWWQRKYPLAVFFVAIASLLGWPFVAIMGIPIAVDMMLRKNLFRTFFNWCSISAATISIPMIMIDSFYYGKLTFAPFNIVWYNVFTSHGPNIFGTEPWSYYVVNAFLNYNIIWLLSLLTPIMLVIDNVVVSAKSKSASNFPRYLALAPFYLWLLIFFIQPHKEERFLFPIYPLISLCGAISVDICQRLLYLAFKVLYGVSETQYVNHTKIIQTFVILISTLISLSRVFALYHNYHAPMDIMMELSNFTDSKEYQFEETYNVCIGKDWYRNPGSFFFPAKNFRLRFLKSEFRGMLPAYFADGPNSTQIVHSYFNNINQENEYMYFEYEMCHFLIEFDNDVHTSLEPIYSKRTKDWIILKSLPFIIKEKSNSFCRAFYIPFISDKCTVFGNFNLLQRK